MAKHKNYCEFSAQIWGKDPEIVLKWGVRNSQPVGRAATALNDNLT